MHKKKIYTVQKKIVFDQKKLKINIKFQSKKKEFNLNIFQNIRILMILKDAESHFESKSFR